MNPSVRLRAVLKERAADWFELERESPYMMLVGDRGRPPAKTAPAAKAAFGIEQLKQTRSTIPAVTHVDYSARVQPSTQIPTHVFINY